MNEHHGDEQSEMIKRFMKQVDGKADRTYSGGRLSGDDDGDLAFMVGHDPQKKVVVIDYGKLVRWVGMPAEQAVGLAQLIIDHALAVSDGRPLSITINGTARNLKR